LSSPNQENNRKYFPVTLDDIGPTKEVIESKEKDARDVLEESRLQAEAARQEIEDHKSNRELRETLANRVLLYLEIYSAAVFLLLIFDGFSFFGFNLPDNSMLALVGSTAMAAIGLVGFVAKGLFK
jgi:hypothetical protein